MQSVTMELLVGESASASVKKAGWEPIVVSFSELQLERNRKENI